MKESGLQGSQMGSGFLMDLSLWKTSLGIRTWLLPPFSTSRLAVCQHTAQRRPWVGRFKIPSLGTLAAGMVYSLGALQSGDFGSPIHTRVPLQTDPEGYPLSIMGPVRILVGTCKDPGNQRV